MAKSITYPEHFANTLNTRDKIIPIDNLIAIILFADYASLSSDLSSTFCISHKYEPFSLIKKRHAKYYWLSKCLRDITNNYWQTYDENRGLLDPVRGPFYLGLPEVKLVSQFSINTYRPILLSTQMTVATNFAVGNGILLEISNSEGLSEYTQGFDISWISRYGLQNDERYK